MNMQKNIQEKLQKFFQPSHLEVINESDQHNVPAGSESHFKVVIVSQKFMDLTLLKQHRMVNEVLVDELNGKIHALAIHTFTAGLWQAESPDSPPCLGGGK